MASSPSDGKSSRLKPLPRDQRHRAKRVAACAAAAAWQARCAPHGAGRAHARRVSGGVIDVFASGRGSMSDFTVHLLPRTPLVQVRDVLCAGSCRRPGAVERAGRTQLVFPSRGSYMRHVDGAEAVADAGQVLFFNAGEDYQVSHPNPGGDASLSLWMDAQLLREVAPAALLHPGEPLRFREPRLRIDPRAQVLVALLRHALHEGVAEPLEAESLALTLVHRALAPRTTHAAGSSHGRQRLVDRARLVLARDLARRWTLAEAAAQAGVSPVYRT